MSAGDDQVTVGVVGKALGLRGEVLVRPDADLPPEVFSVGRTFGVRPVAADPDSSGLWPATLRIASTRVHAGRRIVRFADVETRERAEGLRTAQLTLSRAEIALDDDAFWSADLLGREVVDSTGAVVGVLEAVADGAAHDYLVVARADGGELLIPAVSDLVTVGTDAIVVDAIPGLLDPDLPDADVPDADLPNPGD